MKSVGDAPPHANTFDALRLVAALIVIFGHEFSIRGLEQPVLYGSHIASLGVKIFFCLSGWLVAQSFAGDPDAARFLARRALRILPGLAACVLATVFVLGPLVAHDPAGYFAAPSTWAYLWNLAFGFVEHIPTLFPANPLPHAVNGSLWSLPAEAAMYVLLLGAGLLAAGRPARWLALTVTQFALAVGTVYAFGLFGWGEVLVYGTRLSAFCAVAGFFTAGTLLFLLRETLPLRPVYALAALLATAPLAGSALFPLIEPLTVAYAVLAVGLARTPVLSGAGRFGDFSYGLYLYAYPIQQAVRQAFGERLGFAGALALSLAAAFVCAALSWRFVEKRALAFKPRRPSGASAPPGRGRLASGFPNPPGGPARSAAAH